MPTNLPLSGQNIVLTGTKMTHSVSSHILERGGNVYHLPLITVQEATSSNDGEKLSKALNSEWLIFTSQNAVEAFSQKLARTSLSIEKSRAKIAAVGEKTASALEKIGFQIDFMPSTYSADKFVVEFPKVAGKVESCLFLKGSLAKATIKEGLPFPVDEWTVYETIQSTEHISELTTLIQKSKDATIIFASPSAVDVFNKYVVPQTSWRGYQIAAIGHVTEQALLNAGAMVDVKPEKYTMLAIIEELAKKKGRSS